MNVPIFTTCPVLYDKQDLLIISKPEGVLSHPNPSQGNQTAAGKTRCAFEGTYDFNDRSFRTEEGTLWLIHRLDQDTSGVLIAARTKQAAQQCRLLFEKDQIKKYYTALVAGKVTPAQGQWKDTIIIQKQKNKVRSRAVASGTPNAKLRYEVLSFFPRKMLSLIRVELMTGKTHQIRVQSAFHRYPIVGDEIYGLFSLNKELRRDLGLRRLFLHASAVEFRHPATQELLNIESPLPEKLQAVLNQLKEPSRRDF